MKLYTQKKLTYFSLVKIKLDGHELPNTLPDHLVPPSKRHLIANGSPTPGNAGIYPTISGSSSGEHIGGDS